MIREFRFPSAKPTCHLSAMSIAEYPKPPFAKQQQPMPGSTGKMDPIPDHGERSYKGSGRLAGKKAIITGGDSGIGRAVAIAYAREGADLLISYLSEHADADETKSLVEAEGRKAVLVPGDIQAAAHCRSIVDQAMSRAGGDRYSRQQCSSSGDVQGYSGYHGRRVGTHFSRQHSCHVLSG